MLQGREVRSRDHRHRACERRPAQPIDDPMGGQRTERLVAEDSRQDRRRRAGTIADQLHHPQPPGLAIDPSTNADNPITNTHDHRQIPPSIAGPTSPAYRLGGAAIPTDPADQSSRRRLVTVGETQVVLLRHAYVLPAYQRRGVASMLHDYVERQITGVGQVVVGTYAANYKARRLLEKSGYRLSSDSEAVLRRYYEIPEDRLQSSVTYEKVI